MSQVKLRSNLYEFLLSFIAFSNILSVLKRGESTLAWEDNFSKLVEQTLPINDKKEWRFVMEEHKTKGTMQIGIRQFSIAGSYTGPTKNGMIISVDSEEQIEEFRKNFNDFIDKVKEML